MPTTQAATLDLRVSKEQKELIRRAAVSRGQSMTEFVLSAVEPLARALIERQHTIELSQSAWQAFLDLMDSDIPAPPLAKQEAAEFLKEFAPDGSCAS